MTKEPMSVLFRVLAAFVLVAVGGCSSSPTGVIESDTRLKTNVEQNTPWLGGPDPFFDMSDSGSYVLSGIEVCSVWVNGRLDTAALSPDSLFCRVVTGDSFSVTTNAGEKISGLYPRTMIFDTSREFGDSGAVTRFFAVEPSGVYQRAIEDEGGVIRKTNDRTLALPYENGWFITGRPWKSTMLIPNPVSGNSYTTKRGIFDFSWSEGDVSLSPGHSIILYEFSKMLGDDNSYKFLSLSTYYLVSGEIKQDNKTVRVTGTITVTSIRGAYSYASIIFDYSREDILVFSYKDGSETVKKRHVFLNRRRGSSPVENIILDDYYLN